MLDATQPKGTNYYSKSEFLSHLSDDLLDTFRQQAAPIESPMSQMVIFQLGGAVGDADPGTTAFGNRDAAYVLNAAAAWRPDTPDGTRYRDWARAAWEAFRPYSTGGNYVNFQTSDEGEDPTREAYRDTLERLARLKAVYDPGNHVLGEPEHPPGTFCAELTTLRSSTRQRTPTSSLGHV